LPAEGATTTKDTKLTKGCLAGGGIITYALVIFVASVVELPLRV
jgi:hypothetical protein